MWSNFLDSDIVKDIVEFGTELIKLVDNVGLFKVALMGVGMYLTRNMGWGDMLFKPAVENLDTMREKLAEFKTDMDNAVAKDGKRKTRKSHQKVADTTDRYNTYKTKVDEAEKAQKINELTAEHNALIDKKIAAQEDYNKANHEFIQAARDGSDPVAMEAYSNAANHAKAELDAIDDQILKNGTDLEDLGVDVKNLDAKIAQAGDTAAAAGKKGANGFKKLGAGLKSAGKQIAGIVAQIATMYAITTALELGGKLIEAISERSKKNSKTYDAAKEKFGELNNELDSTKSELRGLESELDKTNDRIEELLAQDTLSLVEQEELSKLQATTKELERQIQLNEVLMKQKQQSVNDASFNAMEKYYANTSFYSEQSKTERQSEAKSVGTTIGSAAGLIIGGIIGTFVGGNTLIGAGVGSALFSGLGGLIGTSISGDAYDAEISVGDAVDKITLIRAGLQADIDRAEQVIIDADGKATNKQKQDLQDAEEALSNFDTNMATAMNQLQQYLNAIDYSSLTDPKEQQKYRDALDDFLAYNIEMGVSGATTTALDTMLSDDFITSDFERVRDILTTALDVSDDIDFTYLEDGGFSEQDQQAIDAVRERLAGVNLTTSQLIGYFKALQAAEREAMEYETYGVVKEVQKLTDGVGLLKEAFDEFNESGIITAETLVKLNDIFGNTDGWKEYVDIVSSGAASIQEVIDKTSNLAENWVVDKIDDPFAFATFTGEYDENGAKIFKQNKSAYQAYITEIQQLRSIGVSNARELVDAAQQKGLVQAAVNTIKEVQRIEALGKGASPKELAWLEKNRKENAEGYAEAIYDAYGIQIQNTDLIQKQFELSEAQDKLSVYDKYKNDYFGISENNLSKFAASIGKSKDLFDEIRDLEEQKKNYSLEDAANDTPFWQKVVESITFGDDKVGTVQREQKFDELDGYISDANDALDEQVKERQRLWDELVEIANSEGLDKIGISSDLLDQFNPNDLTDDSVFNQVYEAIRLYLYGEDGNGGKVAELKAAEEEILAQLGTAFDSIGLEVVLELQDKDKLIDDIQSIYDELYNAQKEYAENGYLSVDTMQSLLRLEPKYLEMLIDEDGNLNLNKEALQDVARARIIDLGLKQQSAIVDQALALAQQGSIDALNNWILVNESADESMKDTISTTKQLILSTLEAREAAGELPEGYANNFMGILENQLNAVQTVTDLALQDLDNSLSNSGNTGISEAESEWDKLVSKYENKLALITNERDLIQAEIDRVEAQGGKASTQYYKDLIRNSSEEKALLIEKKKALEDYLEQYGDTIDSDTWTDYNNEINETAIAIKECTTNLMGFYDALEDISKHYFDQTTNDVSRLGKEIEFVQGLLDGEDLVDDDGNFTESGYAMLGLYVNEMERAAASAAMYDDEINKVNGSWEAYQALVTNAEDINGDGMVDASDLSEEALNNLSDTYGYVITSEEEYREKTDELVDAKYGEIDAYNAAKDGIVELNEERIDAIKNGIEKEIEAYEDYIDTVKEALDAERDLYDFKKSIQKQTKDIASLERRIAALSGSNNAADVAERRKLEAQLLESKEDLNDSYYDHAKDQQSKALDDEAAAFSESKEKYIEELEKTLEDVETLITNSIMDVMTNADTVLIGLNDIANKYGITLSTELTTPWENAKNKPAEYWQGAQNAIQGYADFLTKEELGSDFENTITGFGNQIKTLVTRWNEVETAARNAHAEQARVPTVGGTGTGGSDNGSGGSTTTPPMTAMHSAGTLSAYTSFIVQRPDGGKAYAKKTIGGMDYVYDHVNQVYYPLYLGALNRSKDDQGRIWESYRFAPGTEYFKYYAKGTTGTSRDQWAITDEPWLGDELVLVPGKDGNLSYMRKGTGVVPADLTSNLMEWGKFTPDALNLSGGVNINMINNAVNKPEFNFTFDALVKAERIDENTLPEVKKFVQQEINSLVKQMNYAIKGKGGR